MWIVRLALRRLYTVAVLCVLIFIFGWLSATRMRVDIFPTIDIPVVIVVWNYPGLPAEDMERRVVIISERAYSSTVSGITRIDSQSTSGLGILKVYFEPDADIGGAIAQITSVSLTASRIMPPGITPPAIIRYNASNVPVAQLTVSSDTLSEQQLYDYGLNFIRIRLFTIPGLSTPAPFGGRQRQIMVDLDPAKAAAKETIPLIKATAPEGMELKIDFDQSLFVRGAIFNVLQEAAISSLLVSLMIFGFLGSWRSMVIVSTSIPLAILVGVSGLFLSGQSLNIMTL